MITRSKVRWGGLLRESRNVLLGMLVYVVAVVAVRKAGMEHEVPIAIPALLGTAISILLGFRTNAAYNRWWEARKIWGGIVNDSRTLARQVLTLFSLPEGGADRGEELAALQKEMVYRQIAWNQVLARSLRKQDPLRRLDGLLPADERAALAAQDNKTNGLLHTQTVRLAHALRRGFVDQILVLPIEDTLRRFSDHMGKCERIKSTKFPTHYGYLVSRIVWLFFLLLPPALAPYLGWVSVPVVFVVSVAFLLIEIVARNLENPFENVKTDTPMTAICRTIEINLRQQLGETPVPEKLEPVDGVLM